MTIWHPYTQMKISPQPLKIRSGKGAMLELEDGRKLIDCISSWWVNLHGHSHPKIAEAIYKQALQLEHVIFAQYVHEPAERLARMLLDLLPMHLSKVFFSDNGSTAVEIALKQAYQYWVNKGEEKRQTFLCFDGGFHGETLGAMSLGSRSIFNRHFNDLMFEAKFAPFPYIDSEDTNIEEKEKQTLDLLQKEFEENPSKYAAVVIEPLVQGVSGMRICRIEFIQKLEKLIRQHNLLLIYDEVMTGFGRTGDWFACRKSKTCPDIICLAKGLTGGFLPLAVTICSEEIYQSFYSDDRLKTLFHGHSYTANPLGCAAAIASIELLKENESQFKMMENRHLLHMQELSSHPKIKNLRSCGTIVAMDILTDESTSFNHGMKLRLNLEEEGILVRPLGSVLYLMPPYCITDQQLEKVYSSISKVLKM